MKLLHIITLLLTIPIISTGQDRKTDALALVTIYKDLGGTDWTNNQGWLSTEALEKWHKIKVKDERFIELKLSINNVVGEFPEAIYDLTGLEKLDIFYGTVTGELSEKIYHLAELRVMALEKLEMSSTIPDLENFPKLSNIRFNENHFSGPLPRILKESSLVRFSSNQFSGNIPESWTDNQLTVLHVSNNNL